MQSGGLLRPYRVRPVFWDFIPFVILLPIFIVEAWLLEGVFREIKVRDPSQIVIAKAEITEHKVGSNPREEDIHYRFQVEGDPTWYSATDITGRRNLWIPITTAAWLNASQNGMTIPVAYALEDPWINRPVDQAGIPLGDSICLWSFVFVIDLVSFWEFFTIIRHYLRCRDAAKRGLYYRLRYWASEGKAL
jgi:hypothetical protein